LCLGALGEWKKLGFVLRELLPAPDDAVAIDGVELAEIAAAPSLVGCDQRRAAAAEEIENDRSSLRDVLDGVRDHRHGLHGRVERKLVHAAGAKAVHPTVLPNVGAIAPVLAELEGIDVRRRALA
jgi:hypothetical protein